MLNVFRENLKHLKWVLLLVVASFVLTIFAVWGGGVRTRDSGGVAAPWAAKVDGEVIGVPAFQREAGNLEATYRQIFGDQFSQQREFIKVGRMAINNLVDRELMAREAERAGLLVSEPEVAEAIMREPALQQNGVFIGRERYERLFRANEANLQAYEAEVRQNLLLNKLRSLVQDSVAVSDNELRESYARQNEKITIQYLLLDAKRLPTPAPTDRTVQEYYRTHLGEYQSGEGRSGRYVIVDTRDILSGIDVPEAEIHSEYLQGLKTLYTTPEKRRASHILFKLPQDPKSDQVSSAEGKARKALARIRGGEDFAHVAREMSEDSTASAGGDLNYFTRDQMVREFADATWSLAPGQVSEPVRSPLGIHVIRLAEVLPAKELTLEEARPQILARLRAGKAISEARRRADDLVSKSRSGGGGLEAGAKAGGMVSREFRGVHPGEEIAGLGREQGLGERLFSLKVGEVSEPIPLSSGLAVVQYTSATPTAPLALEKVRDRVTRDLLRETQTEAARRMLEAAGGTSNLPSTARQLKVELKSAGPLPRNGPFPDLGEGPDLIARLFALHAGEVVGPLPAPSGFAVIRLVSHSDPMEGFAAQEEGLRNGLLLAKRDRFFRAYLERLRGSSRIEINTPLVDQVDKA